MTAPGIAAPRRRIGVVAGLAVTVLALTVIGVLTLSRVFRAHDRRVEVPAVPPVTASEGKIAFVSEQEGNYDIYVMNDDGTHVVRFTDDPGYDVWPSWSPDGGKIAFSSDRGGGGDFDIYVMNADGGEVRSLAGSELLTESQPAWSPDGKSIAFSAFGGAGTNQTYVMNADGSNVEQLTDVREGADHPAWSPDGTHIAFSVPAPAPGGAIYVVDADGGKPRKIFADEPDALVFLRADSWSPDGEWIAYTRAHGGASSDIYLISVDGTVVKRLTDDGMSDAFSWSSDGQQIAFVQLKRGIEHIYVMDSDGTKRVQLASAPAGIALGLSWSS